MKIEELLVEIENKNELIESILDKSYSLQDEDFDKIDALYAEKKILVNKIISTNNQDNILNKLKGKLFNYLENDKKVLDKLNKKVKIYGELVKNSSSNKKLLIYSKGAR